MKSKINILLLFIAYLFSVAHNVIPHEHTHSELYNSNYNHTHLKNDSCSYEIFDELLDSFSLHHHQHKKDDNIPFPHSHIVLGHDNNQIRSEFKTIIHPFINCVKNTTFTNPNIFDITYLTFECISVIIKPPDYYSFNSFRAPPFIS